MKKILSLLLVLSMLFSAFAVLGTGAFAEDEEEPEIENPFTDVKPGKWYTKGVLFCYSHGYMSGVTDTLFDPNGSTTRAMFVQILAKVAEADLSVYTKDTEGLPFTDVKASWYIKALKWAYENGYTTGTSATTFSPEANVTRQEIAVFLYTFSEKAGYDVEFESDLNYFHKDVDKLAKWAKKAMTWAVYIGLVSGTADETLSPKDKCTRAQIALIIKKYIEYYSSECEHDWTGPTCTEGRQCTICGYTAGTPTGHTSYATCTEDSEACERCGRVEAALGHTSNPTCTKSAKCTRCGMEFAALGHDIKTPATCTSASSACTRCGYTENALGHSYATPATCTSASSACTRCGNVQAAYGHNYATPATCTSASSACTRCGNVQAALGHTTNNGVCSRCGLEIYPDLASKLRAYIRKNGDKYNNGYYIGTSYQNAQVTLNLISDGTTITIDCGYLLDTGDYFVTEIYIPYFGSYYEFLFGLLDGNTGEFYYVGNGVMNANTFNENTILRFSEYYDTNDLSDKADWEETCSLVTDLGLWLFGEDISGTDIIGGITLKDMGFLIF